MANNQFLLEYISQKAIQLFDFQLKNWHTVATNYTLLQHIEEKTFDFGDCRVKVQYNPARATSSNAKIDRQSISERPCFLCSNQLPPEQKALPLPDDFNLLVNPYPIFSPHFTIPNIRHIPQQIMPYFGTMLKISRLLPDFIVFYNGPRCGASAPDHLHFQAAPKGIMPVEQEIETKKKTAKSIDENCFLIQDRLRSYFLIESDRESKIESSFQKIYHELARQDPEEPMLNILSSSSGNRFRIIIFPRKSHRPKQYFAEEPEKLIISPGAVDMAGILIISRKKDFDQLTADDIKSIYDQVSLRPDECYCCK
ncbi:MAG: DUF4922 domain-containing protein [Candidatus Azobacteroides sp.]|nr:DUF4922 domain-containing protein [Candidatus Azobacteroides sp.]